MKKILSTLVMCLILGVSYLHAEVTITAKAVIYDQTKSNAERVSGGGTVQAHIVTNDGWLYDTWGSGSEGVTSSISSSESNPSYSADVKTTNEGYYFYQWEEENGTKITQKSNSTSIKDTKISSSKTVYAVYKPVTVDNANNGTISVTDITPATQEGTVTFNVTGADNINDFHTPTILGEGFAYKSMSYANNVITVTVTYTVQNKDNVNGDPKQNYSATVTLRSKGDADGTQAKQATITATESLKPAFTIPATLDLTPDAPALTAAPAQKPFTITPTNQVAANASWDATLPQEAKDLGFSVETSATTVTVNFTPKDNDYQEGLTATLSITGSYTDINEKIITNTQSVSLSADKGSAVKINGTTTASYDFGTKEYTDQAYTHDLSYASNISNGLTHSWVNGNFMHTISGSAITITLPNTLIPGDYSDKLSVKYDETEVASLAASAKVRLAQPQIESKVYMSQVLLTWKNVYGAKQYILKSGETVIDISDVMTSETIATASTSASHTRSYSKMITAISDVPLSTGTEYPFTLTVVYGDDVNNVNDDTKISSTTITATPTATTTITAGDVPLLGIYTGTEKAGAYPYHKDGKRLVDLSAAFKDGKAIFDQLFIFGLTIGDANDVIHVPEKTTNSNAVTPCYIYNKSGDNYVLDQTIENVNVADKPDAFIITAAGQKIYFTGYAPYASCGYTWEENGVFYIKGSNNIDIYLNDFELYARHKTSVGNYPETKTFEVNKDNVASYLGKDEFELDMTIIPFQFNSINVYSQGSGAAFCFYPNTNNFCANIHLSGDNVLQSARGMDVHVNVSVGLTMDDTADQHSAPIQIIHDKNSKSRSTTLTIDDKWVSGDRTNGVLDLARIDYRHAPTIDLGNEKTTLIFDGGQIYLSNSFNTSSTYSVSYAISYRYYSIKDGMAKMYGLGSDQPGGTVLFKDGTIECKPLKDAVINANETAKAIFKNLFHNASSMKCPANTKIDGGTFNCDVLACNSSTSKGGSPTNSNDSPLCMVDVPVQSQLANGLVETLVDNWMDYADANGANTNILGYYGIQSMTPEQITDENGEPLLVVHMMLPSNDICFKEEITTHWVMCYPQLSITTNQDLAAGGELGGDKEVPFSIQTDDDTKLVTIEKTSKFLFASMDDITINAVSTYSAPGNSTDIELLDGGFPANILNEEEYVIYDKVYMLMPLVANEWKLFSPPFDISNVYVIESYPENKLIEKFSNGATDKKGNPIITGDKIAEAREAQAHRMIDMLYHWIWENDATGGNSDVWSNRKGYPAMGHLYSVGTFMQSWYDMYDASERPVIEQLYHYKSNNEGYPKGMSRWDANFYLYEVDGESWVIDENGLQTSWKEVPTISTPRDIKGTNNVIMEKGHVYSMSFPYTIVNSQIHNPATVWDYWTGKYILLEGYPSAETTIDSDGDGILDSRGQKIAGFNAMDDIMEEYIEPGKAVVRGNYTFSSNEVSSDNVFVINGNNENEYQTAYDHNVFVNYETAWLYPAECFVYANAPASSFGMPRRIASVNPQSGEITYRDETTTSTPTIAGNNQMFVYNIAGGVGIVPVVAQQVSIYNAAGQLVTSEYLTDEVHISLPTGIYLIAGARDQFKAVVK